MLGKYYPIELQPQPSNDFLVKCMLFSYKIHLVHFIQNIKNKSVKIHAPSQRQKQTNKRPNYLFQVGQTKVTAQILGENLFLQDLQTNFARSKVFMEANEMLALFPS